MAVSPPVRRTAAGSVVLSVHWSIALRGNHPRGQQVGWQVLAENVERAPRVQGVCYPGDHVASHFGDRAVLVQVSTVMKNSPEIHQLEFGDGGLDGTASHRSRSMDEDARVPAL